MNLGFWYCVLVISCHGTHSFGYILVMLTIIQNSIFCPCGFSFRNPFLTPKAIHSHPMKFMLPSHPHPPIPGPTSLLLQPRPARHARLAFPRPAPRLCGQSSQACAGYGCTTSVLTPVIYIYIYQHSQNCKNSYSSRKKKHFFRFLAILRVDWGILATARFSRNSFFSP